MCMCVCVCLEASTSSQMTGLTIGKSAADKMTDTITRWIVSDCTLNNIVEDIGFTDILKATTFSYILNYACFFHIIYTIIQISHK